VKVGSVAKAQADSIAAVVGTAFAASEVELEGDR
jgi:hypothetical protein